jgi:hypothetical protein
MGRTPGRPMSSAPSHIRRNEPWSKIHPPFRALCRAPISRRKRRDLARARYRADRGMTPSKRNTALIFAGTAMVLGILWVNSGTSQQASNRDLTAPGGAAQERRDIVARETVDYAAVAPQPDRWAQAGATPTHRCSIRSRGSWPRRSDRPCHAARCGARTDRRDGRPAESGGPGATIDTHRLWRARSRWETRKARRRRPRARNRPKIQERQGVRRAGAQCAGFA